MKHGPGPSRGGWAAAGVIVVTILAGGGYAAAESMGGGPTSPTNHSRPLAAAPSSAVPVTTSAAPSAPPSPSPSHHRPSKRRHPTPRTTTPAGVGQRRGIVTVPGGKVAQYAAQVVSLVNTQRGQNGCGLLTVNSRLTLAAQRQTDDMVARHFFDHTNPDGVDPGARITATGYRWSTYGENIAYGQQTPSEVMDSWMHSPGHRANILNCAFQEIGVGVNLNSGVPYWTQDFGAP